MKNSEIKRAIKGSRIMQYGGGGGGGISEYTLCKWFRKELTAEQQERILAAIADIKAGEAHA